MYIIPYCFTCGYCDETLITPHRDAVAAHRHAQEQGWRMTYGNSRVFGEGAQNTCPRCVGDDADAIPMFGG